MRFNIIIVMLPAVAIVTGCASPVSDVADEMILYSLDGRDFPEGKEPKTEEHFHNYPVLGKVKIDDAATRKQILASINDGIAHGKSPAPCFWPRHGVKLGRGGKETDLVICFECSQMRIYDGSSTRSRTTSKAPEMVLDTILVESGVKLASKSSRWQEDE